MLPARLPYRGGGSDGLRRRRRGPAKGGRAAGPEGRFQGRGGVGAGPPGAHAAGGGGDHRRNFGKPPESVIFSSRYLLLVAARKHQGNRTPPALNPPLSRYGMHTSPPLRRGTEHESVHALVLSGKRRKARFDLNR